MSAPVNPTMGERRPSPLQARWQALAPRERRLVALAAACVGLALLWAVALAPAVRTWRQSEATRAALDRQLQQMQQLQAQARALQTQPKLRRGDAQQALESSARQRLGPGAQLSLQGDQATLTLKGVPAEALAQWLAQVRTSARVVPLQARLVRSPGPRDGAAAWDGTVLLALPAN